MIRNKKTYSKFESKLDRLKNSKFFPTNHNYELQLEYFIESSEDFSVFGNINETKKWFRKIRKSNQMKIKKFDISKLDQWKINKKKIYHASNDFFKIEGIRTFTQIRESNQNYWDQPIITQVGYDGGILGLIRKKIFGNPHYLCEAKFEPGNYKLVQISPSLQATFSNINKAHNGRSPYFYDLFINKKNNHKILFDSWTSEDGGRFLKKRNRSILIEVPHNYKIKIPNNNFRWLSLFQIKALLKENAWINPHLRGIIAHT